MNCFWIRIFRIFSIASALVFLPFQAFAKSTFHQDRFCIQRIAAPEDVRGVRGVFQFEKSTHTVFFLGETAHGDPQLLMDNQFIEIDLHIPRSWKIVEAQNGEVYVYGMKGDDRPLFKLRPDSRAFEKVEVQGLQDLFTIDKMSWSTPLNGILISKGSKLNSQRKEIKKAQLFLLKDNKLSILPQVEGWVTKIIDFPELNITFLGTEKKDRIYIIDGNKNIHYLAELNLGKWVFFANVFYIKNSHQLLVIVTEFSGPFHDSFLIDLEYSGNIVRPTKKQEFKSLKKLSWWLDKPYPGYYSKDLQEYLVLGKNYEDYNFKFGPIKQKKVNTPIRLYRFAGRDFEEISELSNTYFDLLSYSELKYRLQHPDADLKKPSTYEKTIDLPDSKLFAVFGENGVYVSNQSGEKIPVYIDSNDYIRFAHVEYLRKQKALFFATKSGYFLLKDKEIHSEACKQ